MTANRPPSYRLIYVSIVCAAACAHHSAKRLETSPPPQQGYQNPPLLKASSSPSQATKLTENLNATVLLANKSRMSHVPKLADRNKMCSRKHECSKGCNWDVGKWSDEPSVGFCSGALVTSDVVITNRHCACYLAQSEHIRVHPANWGDKWNDGVDDWRMVTHVMVDSDLIDSSSCAHDIAFLKLDRKLENVGTIELPDHSDARKISGKRRPAYMIGTPLGIPDTVAEGTIDWSESPKPTCGIHDIYHAMHSSGSPIYDSGDGAFLGIHTGNVSGACTKPWERDGKILFPSCPRLAGDYIAIPPKWIDDMLENGKWVDARNGRSDYCAPGGSKKEKAVDIPPYPSSGWDWC